jgi:hypothetical protein
MPYGEDERVNVEDEEETRRVWRSFSTEANFLRAAPKDFAARPAAAPSIRSARSAKLKTDAQAAQPPRFNRRNALGISLATPFS